MDRGDRSWVTGVHIPKKEEGGSIAQLLQQDAVGSHPEAGSEQFTRTDLGKTLAVLGVEQPDTVVMRNDEFGSILDRDQSLVRRDRRNQRLGQRGLARAGRAGDDDVAAS